MDGAVTNHNRPEWPGELAGVVHWGLLCEALGGRHPKHAPRAMAVAIEMIVVLHVTQATAAQRIEHYIESEVGRRRVALAEAWTRETLRKKFGIEN